MEPGKQAFDFPASAVAPESAPVLGFGPSAVRFVGRDQLDAVLLFEMRVQRIAVVGAVADQASRKRRREALLDGGFDEFGFMGRSACNPHRDRKTTAVRNCHDFGPFAAACWTHCTAPFLALLKEASMKLSDKSNCPRASRSSARARKTWTSVPSRTQRWKRRWQVWYGGNLSFGNSAHCAPVRKIHNTPSSTCRVSRHGRPRRLPGVFGSTNGCSSSHCTSVSSIPTGVPLNSTPHNYLVRFVFMR